MLAVNYGGPPLKVSCEVPIARPMDAFATAPVGDAWVDSQRSSRRVCRGCGWAVLAADHDPLTGVQNRRALQRTLAQHTTRERRQAMTGGLGSGLAVGSIRGGAA